MMGGLVIVDTPSGTVRFAGCTADCYALGELTITDLQTFDERRVFQPGSWREASVFDHIGHLLFSFDMCPRPIVVRRLQAKPAARNSIHGR